MSGGAGKLSGGADGLAILMGAQGVSERGERGCRDKVIDLPASFGVAGQWLRVYFNNPPNATKPRIVGARWSDGLVSKECQIPRVHIWFWGERGYNKVIAVLSISRCTCPYCRSLFCVSCPALSRGNTCNHDNHYYSHRHRELPSRMFSLCLPHESCSGLYRRAARRRQRWRRHPCWRSIVPLRR